MSNIISYVLSAIVVMVVISLLLAISGRKSKRSSGLGSSDAKKSKKSKAQELKEANRRLAKDPHDPAGLAPVGDMYFNNQLWEKAFPMYDQLAKMAAANPTIDAFKSNLRAGICALNINRQKDALGYLTTALKLNGFDFDANYNLGMLLYKAKQYEKAVPCFKKALVSQPEAEGVYFYLGLCLYNSHHFKDSLPCFKKALDEDPTNKEALFDMADAMTEEGHGEKAIRVFMHLRADPVYGAKSCLQAGIYHLKVNDEESAIQDFEIGLKHEDAPLDIRLEIEYRLAVSYLGQNQINKGLALLKDIRQANMAYKDVNALIARYQELSQNTNLQIYLSAPNSDFVALCRKFLAVKYKNATIKISDINVGAAYTDIVSSIETTKWRETQVFRFFRTNGATSELYLRDFHGHMQDIKAERGFCVTAGIFSEEAHKFVEGRPIDLIEKNELNKYLKEINLK